MKSVPPRGSGWADGMAIADFRLAIGRMHASRSHPNQSAIGIRRAHPLPRGGTDLLGPFVDSNLHHYQRGRRKTRLSIVSPVATKWRAQR
ncbi:MAG TPA: hypothetical protein VJS64_19280 [Pyrinomonadaceae bacterium]|nr:hypothetical protein [Pyrinomonadaceae bacterium]